MKNIALAVTLSTFALSSATAGGLNEPVSEPVLDSAVIVEESKSGKGGYVIQLALLAVLAMHIANN